MEYQTPNQPPAKDQENTARMSPNILETPVEGTPLETSKPSLVPPAPPVRPQALARHAPTPPQPASVLMPITTPAPSRTALEATSVIGTTTSTPASTIAPTAGPAVVATRAAPQAAQGLTQAAVSERFGALVSQGMPPNEAAAQALIQLQEEAATAAAQAVLETPPPMAAGMVTPVNAPPATPKPVENLAPPMVPAAAMATPEPATIEVVAEAVTVTNETPTPAPTPVEAQSVAEAEDGDEAAAAATVETGSGSVSEPAEVREETDEEKSERLARELQESEDLARMLMAEEAEASYHQQYEMIQRATSHADIDTADLYAVQQLLRADEEAQEAVGVAPGAEHDQTEGEDEYDEEGDEEYDEEEEEGEEGATYEELIELGQQIGDVKAERWAMRAESVIASLPTVKHCVGDDKGACQHSYDKEAGCIFCQEDYCEGETLRILPCGHAFHAECVDQWLKEKDTCPMCKACVCEDEAPAGEF